MIENELIIEYRKMRPDLSEDEILKHVQAACLFAEIIIDKSLLPQL